jgi:trk system potassium uptake protein TrkA
VRVYVIGAGDVGAFLAKHLSSRGAEVVLMDVSSSALADAEDVADAMTLAGEAANVHKADLFVAVTGSDTVNVVSAALAAQLGARRTVARVDAPGFYRTESGVEAGTLGVYAFLCASRLISDELLRLARRVDAPYVESFAGNSVHAAVITPGDGSPLLGRPAADIELPRATVAGVLRDHVLRPTEDVVRLEAHDGVLVTGTSSATAEAIDRIHGNRRERKVVLVGGGDVGSLLATSLSERDRRVLVIEHDLDRCHQLSELLPDATIIHGDGTSIRCLRDHHVDTAEYTVAVTRADEVNLMVTLLSAELGVPRTYALVHRPGYREVYEHLRITGTTGPHDVIARMIDWLLPTRGAAAERPLPRTAQTLAEFVLPHDAAAGPRISEVPLPAQSWVVGLSRNMQSRPPLASERLEPEDRVIVACPAGSVKEVGKRLVATARRGGKA